MWRTTNGIISTERLRHTQDMATETLEMPQFDDSVKQERRDV
jgi:hypothetical protein